MQELRCPNCGEVFQVDESGYAQIAQQVRDREFAVELARREQALLERQKAELAVRAAEQARLTEQQHARQVAALAEKEQEIDRLRARLENAETAQRLAVATAVQQKEQALQQRATEITALQGKLQTRDAESQLREKSLIDQYEGRLRLKDEQIAYYKDFKARQSTKMVGESLEQHCLTQFNQIRMSAFPKAYFEKDNDARTGSKGDFIFREAADDGTELISIMFEMKNEMDTTATKHKNEDFLRELDKDRQEKHCEYAVLVSLLESDSELYNTGIVDVSYRYPKMYVIRPQFFIPMISLLRNAALSSLQYRRELAAAKSQQLDVTHFEENMNSFKESFGRNYRLASERFAKAIEEIDKTIDHLQKTKDALLSSTDHLRLANNKAEDLSIKKLTRNAPAVRELFAQRKEP